jgi:hypothetical protein
MYRRRADHSKPRAAMHRRRRDSSDPAFVMYPNRADASDRRRVRFPNPQTPEIIGNHLRAPLLLLIIPFIRLWREQRSLTAIVRSRTTMPRSPNTIPQPSFTRFPLNSPSLYDDPPE